MRRPLGPRVSGGGHSIPSVVMAYEVTVEEDGEFVRLIEYGTTIRSLPTFEALNGTKAQKERAWEATRADLVPQIEAAATLLASLERECLSLDEKRGIKTGFLKEKK